MPAAAGTTPPVVAAVLIVRNEEHCVADALASVRAGVDHWVIVDTGSTDGTVALLERLADDFPGHLHHSTFVDFSTARNELLDLAEPTCDWMVILDADMAWENIELLRREIETVHTEQPDVDGLAVEVGDAETYWQVRAFRCGRGWRYRYRTHELAYCPTGRVAESATRALHYATGGSRADKYERDLRLIGLDLAENPDDPASHYYLAGTLRALGRDREAVQSYRRAVALAGDDSELVYISRFVIAQLAERLGWPEQQVTDAWVEAAGTRPARWEARRRLYARLNSQGRCAGVLALDAVFAESAVGTADRMFVDPAARPWGLAELARAARTVGDEVAYATATAALRADPHTPDRLREAVRGWDA